MSFVRSLPLLAASLATACAAAPAGMAPFRLVDVTGAVVVPGGFAGPTFVLQQIVVPYTLDRLEYIQISVKAGSAAFRDVGQLRPLDGTPVVGRVFPPVVLTSLSPYTDYQVRLRGFLRLPGAGAPIDVTGNPAQSTTAFTTHVTATAADEQDTNEQVTVPAGFAIKLKNQDFSGIATGAIANTNGTVTGPTDPVRVGAEN